VIRGARVWSSCKRGRKNGAHQEFERETGGNYEEGRDETQGKLPVAPEGGGMKGGESFFTIWKGYKA